MGDLDKLIENIESIGIKVPESIEETVSCIDDIINIIDKKDDKDYKNDIETIDELINMIENDDNVINEQPQKEEMKNKSSQSYSKETSSMKPDNKISKEKEISTQLELDSLLELLDSEGYIQEAKVPEKKEDDKENDFSKEMDDFIKDIEILSKEEEKMIQKQPITPRIDERINNNERQKNDKGIIDSERCYKCKENIFDEKKIFILDRYYHLEHFECFICQRVITNEKFFEYNNEPYCKICFESKFCPQCHKCKESIYGPFLNALDKSWHQSCFVCTLCSNQLTGSYFEKDREPYCYNCFNSLSSICKYCNQVIYGNFINALGFKWHPEHFKCYDCHKTLSFLFFEFNGNIYCDEHYYQRKGDICEGCKSLIKGPSIEAMGKKWHPDHFVCSFCSNVISVRQFTEKNEKPYCRECYEKMFM